VSNPRPDRDAILAISRKRRRRSRVLKLVGLVVLAVAAVFAYRWRERSNAPLAFKYSTVAVKLGDLRETVTATGTLKGLNTVDVGAQISGRVSKVLVDYNDRVEQGQVLAEIDPEQLKSRVEQSRAQVQAAEAALGLARATAAQAKAQQERTKGLFSQGLSSHQELEATEADAARAEASVASANAQVALARASLKDVQTSLSYSTIRSPMAGIVLARLVEPGQTVAASLQSPVLFTLASDLTKLELFVDIDEADVGRVHEQQDATFTVDAWPNRAFASKVLSVRNLPTAGQTVVTYQAILAASNDEKLLRPGMTVTATIVTSEKKDVRLVPNAALRFIPPQTQERGQASGMGLFRMSWRGGNTNPPPTLGKSQGMVHVLEANTPVMKVVEIGGSDGEWTQLLDDKVATGAPLVVDVSQAKP
jgi:HlyD family secretion protein